MNYTRGEWIVWWQYPNNKDDSDLRIKLVKHLGGMEDIAIILSPESCDVAVCKANANLIAAAVNGCTSVNPDNPQAVAESIKDTHEALRCVIEYKDELSYGNPSALHLVLGRINDALAKAEDKEA